MSMKAITKEIIEKIGAFKEMVVGLMCDEDMFMSMDPKTLKTMQLLLGMIDDATKLMEEYAQSIEEQNKKLDMILEKLNKEGKAY